MANVILGLLLLRTMSLYDLVRAFEAGVSLFYSASSGSIKRALDDLRSRGLVEAEPVRPGTRGRKAYRVTKAGRHAFEQWMLSTPAESDAERAMLSRLYFLGLLEAPERSRVISAIRTRLEADLARLEAVSRQVDDVQVPADMEEVARYQRVTLDYGLASYRHALEWVRNHLAS
ncbi:PadR family transcriptional regulator [Actinomyces bowdenii]|uniref:PadR family transcriptional regulator n=1 Tax=Actinomyces bowdenii TaxID=131109 RepID=A0A853EJ56_9ACTO|nr:PadR family transcriptional regulator [Actinomyces bowdenii]MBF0697126.1 PadR family transcriptional regulator [Actinomyces bowdenii]NYS69299.1 PadR family transcriptional regulator [Actinomyces bowdenii]